MTSKPRASKRICKAFKKEREMSRQFSKRLAVGASAVALVVAAGLVGASVGTSSTVPTGTITVGQTLQADPSTMVDTAKAVTLTDQGKTYLCKTTVTGVDYHNNWPSYVGGNWQLGLSSLHLAQTISPDAAKQWYEDADIALEQTTITGKKYCMNPSRWPSGMWAAGFSALAQARAYLVANPATDGPSIVVK